MRTILTQLIALSMFDAVLASKYNCSDNPITNGCSVFLYYMPYKEVFEADCNKHDVCYHCGSVLGLTQESCDDTFYKDMYETCATDGWPTFCRAWAKVYFEAVTLLGEIYFSYMYVPEDSCAYDDWYIPCLS